VATALVGTAGVRVRDLPSLSGISSEAIAMCCGYLERRGEARIGADPSGSRFKVLTLTPRGQRARAIRAFDRGNRVALEGALREIVRDALAVCLEQIARAGDPEGATLRASLDLRALDYFRDADTQTDARIDDAADFIASRRQGRSMAPRPRVRRGAGP
jgi:hypothetical protein